MEKCGNSSGTPSKRVEIRSCGMMGKESQGQEGGLKQAKSGAPAGEPSQVQVLHIIRKHKGSRRPSSWREPQITCSRDQAAEFLKGLRAKLAGLDPGDLPK